MCGCVGTKSALFPMEAPISIRDGSHLFRSHSSYSNDIYSMSSPSRDARDSRDTFLQSQRLYPVRHGNINQDRNLLTHDGGQRPREQASRPMAMHPAHSMPQQLNPPPPRSYEPQRHESRVSVSNLVDNALPRMYPNQPAQETAPISPRNVQQSLAEGGRLPSVTQVSIPPLYEAYLKGPDNDS